MENNDGETKRKKKNFFEERKIYIWKIIWSTDKNNMKNNIGDKYKYGK